MNEFEDTQTSEKAKQQLGLLVDMHRSLAQKLHQQRACLDAGEDLLSVALTQILELRKFHGRLLLRGNPLYPLDMAIAALTDVRSGAKPALFRQEEARRGAPELARTKHLRGAVAHLVAGLTTGRNGALGIEEAATVVARRLNKAQFLVPKGGAFVTLIVMRWYDRIYNRARRKDPERQTFEALQQELDRQFPEHDEWTHEQRLEWLDIRVHQIGRLGYFDRHPIQSKI